MYKILFLSFALISTYCNRTPQSYFHSPEEADREQMKKTKVMSVAITRFLSKVGLYYGISTGRDIFYFDTLGRIIRSEYYIHPPTDKKVWVSGSATIYHYDSEGLLIRRISSLRENTDGILTLFEYNNLKQLIMENEYNDELGLEINRQKFFKYDNLGRIIEETEYCKEWRLIEQKNNSSSLYLKDSMNYKYIGSGEKRIRYKHNIYAGMDTVVEDVFHPIADGYFEGSEHNWKKYDTRGFLIEEKSRSSHTFISRTFDQFGNTLELIWSDKNGEKLRFEKFYYEYFK